MSEPTASNEPTLESGSIAASDLSPAERTATRSPASRIAAIAACTALVAGLGGFLIGRTFKDYYDVGVKNDEQLVKLAAIIQKLVVRGENSGEGNNLILSEADRVQLMSEVISISKLKE